MASNSNPPSVPPAWPRPEWLHQLPQRLQVVLHEVYALADRGESILAVSGLRTLIELVARELAGETRPLKATLDVLHARGFLGTQERERLKWVVSHGNAAIHEGTPVSGETLRYLLMCVEHLLQGLFVLRRSVSTP